MSPNVLIRLQVCSLVKNKDFSIFISHNSTAESWEFYTGTYSKRIQHCNDLASLSEKAVVMSAILFDVYFVWHDLAHYTSRKVIV